MKKMRSHFLVVAACAGALFWACSEDSGDVAGGAVEDMGIVADQDTIFVHDSIKVKIRDTVKVKVRDTVKVKIKDTVKVKIKDTVVVKDTINKKDTVVIRDTVPSKDTTFALNKGSITGVSQKGPLAKGSSVTVFELDGTNSLRQTGRSFNGTISSDNGSFKIKNVSLASSYVHLTATGAYRQEVNGKKSSSPITLRALSKLGDGHASVNVNLITHLEYDRVAYLLEHDSRMDLSEAKKQAEKEIFAMFHIDAGKFGYSEDLDIFGEDDADAALLAVSVMLPMNNSASEVMERLTALSEDLAEDGSWDDKKTLDSIAVWTMDLDLNGTLPTIRKNVRSWSTGGNVPDFEKYVRKFWNVYLDFGECGKDVPVGTVKAMPEGVPVKNKDARYICVDSAAVGKVWRVADQIEKDTAGLGREFNEGEIVEGRLDTNALYVFDNGGFRFANDREVYLKTGCTDSLSGSKYKFEHSSFVCKKGLWEFDAVQTERDTLIDWRDSTKFYVIGIGNQVWMAQNVKYHFEMDNFCFMEEVVNCSIYGAEMSVYEALDGRYIDINSEEYQNPPPGACGGVTASRCVLQEEHQGVCPVGYHLPSKSEFEELIRFVDLFNGDEDVATSLKSKSGWAQDADAGTDRFGFNALPAGWEIRSGSGRTVQPSGEESSFWVKPENKNDIHYGTVFFQIKGDSVGFKPSNSSPGGDLRYVRCLKNRIVE